MGEDTGQTNRQTNRQTDRQTDTQIDNKGRLELSGAREPKRQDSKKTFNINELHPAYTEVVISYYLILVLIQICKECKIGDKTQKQTRNKAAIFTSATTLLIPISYVCSCYLLFLM